MYCIDEYIRTCRRSLLMLMRVFHSFSLSLSPSAMTTRYTRTIAFVIRQMGLLLALISGADSTHWHRIILSALSSKSRVSIERFGRQLIFYAWPRSGVPAHLHFSTTIYRVNCTRSKIGNIAEQSLRIKKR